MTLIPLAAPTAVDFFCLFSRFEYALKKTDYLKASKRKGAQPHWDRFVQESDDPELFNHLSTNAHVKYLIDHPPKRQIVANGKLDWVPGEIPVDSLAKLIWSVRRARNNLFHGGKSPAGPIDGTERDERLLQAAIVVLRALLDAHPNINDAFGSE